MLRRFGEPQLHRWTPVISVSGRCTRFWLFQFCHSVSSAIKRTERFFSSVNYSPIFMPLVTFPSNHCTPLHCTALQSIPYKLRMCSHFSHEGLPHFWSSLLADFCPVTPLLQVPLWIVLDFKFSGRKRYSGKISASKNLPSEIYRQKYFKCSIILFPPAPSSWEFHRRG